jgi:phosphotransferase system HPr-like phosphotransfer protein
MTLAAGQGSALTLTTDGPDEHDALVKIRDLFESGFGEQV